MGTAKKAAVKPAAKKKSVTKPVAKKKPVANDASGAEAMPAARAVMVSSGEQPGESELVVPPPTGAERAGYVAETKTVEPAGLSMPFSVFTGESLDAARFVWNRWFAKRDPKTDAVIFPGLELSLSKPEREGKKPPRITQNFAAEISHLVTMAQEKHNAAVLAANSGGDGSLDDRAEFVASEIESVLDWHFSSDGVIDERDAQLSQVRDAHSNDNDSRDALAQRLEDYASLARTYRDEIDGMGDFDARHIDEAFELVDKLRATPRTPKTNETRASALDDRNRFVVLAQRRVLLIRAAAQHVFRKHPKVIREVTSSYLRRRRAEARRAKAAKTAAQPVK